MHVFMFLFYVPVGPSCLIQINEWKNKLMNCKLEMWNKRHDDDDDLVQASVNIMSVFN